MKTWKKGIATLLIAGMIITALPTNAQAAKKSKIKISKKKLTMYVGSTKTLKLKGTKKKPKWTSSKKSVATVTSKGKIKAKKKGTTVITAKLGKKKYSCKVTVKKRTQGTNPPATQASSAPSTTPTGKPGVTPTNKPGVTPTNKPDTTVVANNYQTLANYLRRNGQYDVESEDYYIYDSTTSGDIEIFTTISYNVDGSFEYAIMYSSEESDELVTLTITPPEYGKGAVANIFVYLSDPIFAIGEVSLSSLTATEQNITYTYTNFDDEELAESLYNLGAIVLSIGLQSWSGMLEDTQLGIGLQDLGFTSYNG